MSSLFLTQFRLKARKTNPSWIPGAKERTGSTNRSFLALLSCDDFFNDSAEVEALNAELGAQAAQISW